jgi:all-trans-retinol dehydrogenase (NAD+)
MSSIRGKTILLTGAASGIGKLLTQKFAEEGAAIIIAWDIQSEGLQLLQEEFSPQFPKTQLITNVVDISDCQAVTNAVNQFLKDHRSIDILVNNAGVVSGKSILEISEKEVRRTFDVNILAHFWTIKAVLPVMLQNHNGHIVTISSAGGLIGVNRLSDYSASKFAAFGLDESLRMESHRMKWPIKTTVVCPYFIDTGMFAGVKTRFPFLLPILKPERVAQKIIRAIKKDKKRVFMPWMVYTVPLLRVLPVSWFDFIANFFGINHTMDDFIGRGKTHLLAGEEKAHG